MRNVIRIEISVRVSLGCISIVVRYITEIECIVVGYLSFRLYFT